MCNTKITVCNVDRIIYVKRCLILSRCININNYVRNQNVLHYALELKTNVLIKNAFNKDVGIWDIMFVTTSFIILLIVHHSLKCRPFQTINFQCVAIVAVIR